MHPLTTQQTLALTIILAVIIAASLTLALAILLPTAAPTPQRAPAAGRTEPQPAQTNPAPTSPIETKWRLSEPWIVERHRTINGEPHHCSIMLRYADAYQRAPGQEWKFIERKLERQTLSCRPHTEPTPQPPKHEQSAMPPVKPPTNLTVSRSRIKLMAHRGP